MNRDRAGHGSMKNGGSKRRTGRAAGQLGLLLFDLLFLLPIILLLSGFSAVEYRPVEPVKHVIHISVDGLRSDAISDASESRLKNFFRLRNEAAYTDNARTDYDMSVTLPNHTSQLTGRGVMGPDGHNWTDNGDTESGVTLHNHKGVYIPSVFDVAHDNGLRTAAYVSKSKFELFDRSYNEHNGAEDLVGVDNGRDKIDTFVYDDDTGDLVARFIEDMENDPYGYTFLHLRDPDSHGHSRTWSLKESSSYMKAVEKVDRLLGRIISMIEKNPDLAGNTTIILTSDHGGGGFGHGKASKKENYTIPFYVWGYGIEKTDLYVLNGETYLDPGSDRPSYAEALQPIRNGDAANLALSLLDLTGIQGSTINSAQVLNIGRAPVQLVAKSAPDSPSGVESDSPQGR